MKTTITTLDTIKTWLATVDPHVWESTRHRNDPNEQKGWGVDERYHTIYSTQQVHDIFIEDMGNLARDPTDGQVKREIAPNAFDAMWLTKVQFSRLLAMCGYVSVPRKRRGRWIRSFANTNKNTN